MTPKPPRTPQEKKALSYAHDCRNTYGESDKGARKTIPARKAAESRKSRRKANHALTVVERAQDEDTALIESSLKHDVERVGGWTKAADSPLGEVIERNEAGRVARHGRKLSSRLRRSSEP